MPMPLGFVTVVAPLTLRLPPCPERLTGGVALVLFVDEMFWKMASSVPELVRVSAGPLPLLIVVSLTFRLPTALPEMPKPVVFPKVTPHSWLPDPRLTPLVPATLVVIDGLAPPVAG